MTKHGILAAVAVCASALMRWCIDFTVQIKYKLFRKYLKLRFFYAVHHFSGGLRMYFLLTYVYMKLLSSVFGEKIIPKVEAEA